MALTPAQRQAAVKLRAREYVEKLERGIISVEGLVETRDKKIEVLTEMLAKAEAKVHKLEVAALKAKIKKA